MQRVIWMTTTEPMCRPTACARKERCGRALVAADKGRPLGSYAPTVVMGNAYCAGWVDAAQCVAPVAGPRVHEAVEGLT